VAISESQLCFAIILQPKLLKRMIWMKDVVKVCFISCHLSSLIIIIAQHGTDYKITPVISVCVPVGFIILMNFGTDIWNLKQKNPFLGVQNSITASPIFTLFYPKLTRTLCIFSGVLKHFSGVVLRFMLQTTFLCGSQPLNVKRE